MEKAIRLDKYLADMGKGTRSQAREMIKKGRVRVNGKTEKKTDRKVAVSDCVALDGTQVSYLSYEYYMLNKPSGVISATEDPKKKTVLDLILDKSRRDLFPVGRLDVDTEGLLLITNDGELAHRLLSPKRHVDKVYYAVCSGQVPESAKSAFLEGFTLPDGLSCLPAHLEILETGREQTKILLTLREGKFHQVKRMMEAVGCPVTFLKRLSMGPLALDPSLKPGQYRPLTEGEIHALKTAAFGEEEA